MNPVNDTSVKQAASKDASVDNIIGGVIINDVLSTQIELDTAACKSMIPYETFLKLCKLSKCAPVLENTGTVVRMADGTDSTQVKGFTNLKITRADNPSMSGTFKFIVTEGPNNLLGRPVLKELWSNEYISLVNSANVSKQALCGICKCTCTRRECSSPAAQLTMTSPATSQPRNVTLPSNITVATDTTQVDTTTAARRPIPTPPTGIITQEIGEAYCKRICDEMFP